MRTLKQQKNQDLQNKAFLKSFEEAKKSHSFNDMKMHEISSIHANALLKVGNIKIYGLCASEFVLIKTIDKLADFDKYFID